MLFNAFLISLCVLLICCFLYFWMITPRILGRPDTKVLKTRFFAHRGLHDSKDCPENSIHAFQKAVEKGYGIEMDVQLTKDGVPVVFHDDTLQRVCQKRGKVCEYTYRELQQFRLFDSQEKIPTFREVLSMIKGKVPLIIEIKAYRKPWKVCRKVDRELKDYEGAYCVESFHTGALFWYRTHHRRILRGQLSSDFRKELGKETLPLFSVHHLLVNFLGKPDFIAYNHKFKQERARRICRNLFRIPSAAWTIQSREDLKNAEKYFDVFIFEGFEPV